MENFIFKNCDICNSDYANSKKVAIENNQPIVSFNKCKFINVHYSVVEKIAKVVYTLSFKKINISPTMLTIAKIKIIIEFY